MMGRSITVFLAIVLMVPIGCSGDKKIAHEQQKHLSKLARAYGFYVRKHQGNRPPTMTALKEYVKQMSPEDLASANLEASEVDSMFISTRDGQEYMLRTITGAAGPPGAGGVPGGGGFETVVLYEKEGKDGKRLVAYETTRVEEVDEEKFKQLVPGAN